MNTAISSHNQMDRATTLVLLLLLHCCPSDALLASEDWLVHRPAEPTKFQTLDDGTLLLTNGLIHRRFLVTPNWATLELGHEANLGSVNMLRGFSPEARVKVACPKDPPTNVGRRLLLPYAPDVLEGHTGDSAGVAVGGVRGQERFAWLDATKWNLTSAAQDFQYVHHELASPREQFTWHPGQRQSVNAAWPPRGIQLRVHFSAGERCGCTCGLKVVVVYEMYDGLPTFTKWIEVTNSGSKQLIVREMVVEQLRVSEHAKQRIHAETDFMPRKTFWKYARPPAADKGFGAYNGALMNYPGYWIDPQYEDQKFDQALHADNADGGLLMQLQYPLGPEQPVQPSGSFNSFRSFITLYDSDDEERQALARKRVIRTLFPQVTEQPLYFYSTDASSEGIRRVVDQASVAGFEGLMLSFGAGFDPSSTNESYIAQIKADNDYAEAHGMIMGGYTLMQNPPGLGGTNECKSPDSTPGPGIADFSTPFHQDYRDNIVKFLRATGMKMLETDGPYEGATCGVTNASGFQHQNNSQVAQWQATVEFYQQLKRELNIYNTVPDPYWMAGGTNKEPMGYTDPWNHVPTTSEYLELGRMYLYDGTFHKPTTMGWLAFELSRIPAAPSNQSHISQLSEGQKVLEEALASYLGQGNAACYRGPGLYDANTTPELASVWSLWVAHYKQHRSILMSDMVHIARPSGTSIEVSMHVNASASGSADDPIAFANLFNPTASDLSLTLKLPMYYAGVGINAQVDLKWGGSLTQPDRWPIPSASIQRVLEDYTVRLDVTLAESSFLWVSISHHIV